MIEAYATTTITSQRSAVTGSCFTMNAATSTPSTPPSIRPVAGPQAKRPV